MRIGNSKSFEDQEKSKMNLEMRYKNISLTRFLELLDQDKLFWLVKRLSGNDTGITGGHQSGIYVPRQFMEAVVPAVVTTEQYNPTREISCYIPSQDCLKTGIQAKYYNNKYFPEMKLKKKYDEFRLTRWVGTPLQDVENTGSICILAGTCRNGETELLGWVSNTAEEEELIEYWLGKEVEPGQMYLSSASAEKSDLPLLKQLPVSWLKTFPTGRDIFEFIETHFPQSSWAKSIDELLLKRRALEFDIFSEVERHDVMPNIKDGFTSVDEFIKYANSVANRRKSRAGTSLELHLESIFRYEQLKFEAQVITEQNKKPDFIFPSGKDYHNPAFPSAKLHMLASKTCCKDRWRQVISEADRIEKKHLFTLQQGVSSNQLAEMYQHGIILVVPQPIITSFPEDYRTKIMNLTNFADFIKESQQAV